MMDDTILNCTKTNREQAKNRFFYSRGTQSGYYARSRITVEDAEIQANDLIADLERNNFGYALPKNLRSRY
jgi:hypothetical protein